MTAGTRTAPEGKPAEPLAFHIPWVALAWFGVLLAACYANVIVRLVSQWSYDENMGHGFFVPLVSGYILWQRRGDLLAVKPAPNWWGLVLIFWGAAQLYVATLGAELFLGRTALLISLTGIVLLTGGVPVLRIVAFPLFLLLFMIPIPAIIFNQVTFSLQLLASRLAEFALAVLGVPVLREGNILELASQRLSVVEACSGIRSLLTLSFLALVYAYFFDKRVWMRGVLLVATVPIALVANASRVTVTGLLSEVNPELAEGIFHTASGWVIFMFGLGLLILVHAVVSKTCKLVYGRN